jgi:sigma-B regulation protein RsbU (phosphoserine phosphatase)
MGEVRATESISLHASSGESGHADLTAEARCELLLEISRNIRGTLSLRETLDRLLDGLQDILPYDAGGIFVLREEVAHSAAGPLMQQIAGVSWRGFTPRSPFTDPMLREGKGIVGHVVHTGEAVCAPDVRLDPRYIMGRASTLSEVAVPIQLDGRTIGALNLESDRFAAFHAHDVEVLSFYAEAAAIAVEKAMLHERLVEAGRMDRQLKVAQQVQERLLPALPPEVPGHELAGVCIPSARVGGDYFDYIPLADGRLGLVVADVSGHDLPAALIASAFRALVRTCLRAGHSLEQVAQTLGRELPDCTAGSAFVTALLAILDPASGRLRYVNCGHNPPLHDRATGSHGWLEIGGPLLGLLDNTRFETGEVHLAPGDQVVFFTDGIVEARSPAGEWFAAERLVNLVTANRRLSPRALVEHVVLEARGFAGVSDFEDDVTMVVLRRAS